MPNTTNFNWPTPADTDLVKDGAAAIRNLGNGVDTSLVDLKGGTTGQILSKASNADMDFTFVTPNVGDLTEVQAGTGISVADGTGPIPVVTNTVATAFDAKGDLVVGTGADTFAKLTVGTNGHTLVAKSSEATGLAWEAPAGWSPNYQLLNAGGTTMTGSNTITISGISGVNSLFIRVGGDNLVKNLTANATFRLRLNTDTGQNYYWSGLSVDSGNTASTIGTTVDSYFQLGTFGASTNSSYVMAAIQIDGTGTAGIKPITAATHTAGGTQTSSTAVSLVGSYNGTSAISSISIVSNGTFTGTGQVFVYGA